MPIQYSLNPLILNNIVRLKMQQLFANAMISRWYFAFGDDQKSSLSAQFCRENGFQYYSNPTIEQTQFFKNDTIIEGDLALFQELERIKPELHIIYFGKDYSNQNLKRLRRQYRQIGYCKDVITLDHNSCRKALYPNLIFIYGPIYQQNRAAAQNLASIISYQYSELPEDPNHLIQNTRKTRNYVVNGLFPNSSQIKILDEYFNIRIIHLKYNREDLPGFGPFFDEQQDLIKFLKDKKYYHEIKGSDANPENIMKSVGVKLCPRLLYINGKNNENKEYVDKYLEQTDDLYLSIIDIQQTRKRKNIPIAASLQEKIKILNETIYKDLNRQQIIFGDFPWRTSEFLLLQNYNRKFDCFIDLSPADKYVYSKETSSPIYFLINQKRIAPSFDLTLKQELSKQIQYWIISSPGTCGKTSVAKYMVSQFGYKLIDFQAEAAAAKEKIASPQDGDEVPVRKYIAYFANIIKNNPQNTYVIDTLPYSGADLELWLKQVGSPNVINLKADPNQLIKRMRKKAQGDVNAEVTQQQTTKVNQSIQKNNDWIEKLSEQAPASKIYQVDYNQPQILTQTHINTILRPRIFLAQKNMSLVYQNIAIKYGMGFISLDKNQLRECAALVRQCGKRDVILCHYKQVDERLVSQDLYWIEKNLGEIRYLGIWAPEQTQIKQKLLKLQKPPQPVKKKAAQGQQQKQEQPPAQQNQESKPKKVLNIYQHEWTQPVDHKNLSQWFFKLKKNIEKKQHIQKHCYENFHQILEYLNKDKNNNFYEVVK